MKLPPNLTIEKVLNAVEAQQTTTENPAFCMKCGNKQEAEPDARNYKCENCGEDQVFGAEEILISLL